MGESGVLGPLSTNFQPFGHDFDLGLVLPSGVQPRTPLKAWNWGKPRPEVDSAASKCCQPTGPIFVDPKAPLPGPAVGSGVDPRGRNLAGARCRHEPTAGRGKEAFRSTNGSQGLATWYCLILRVLHPFLALVCPSSHLLRGFQAETLKNTQNGVKFGLGG